MFKVGEIIRFIDKEDDNIEWEMHVKDTDDKNRTYLVDWYRRKPADMKEKFEKNHTMSFDIAKDFQAKNCNWNLVWLKRVDILPEELFEL